MNARKEIVIRDLLLWVFVCHVPLGLYAASECCGFLARKPSYQDSTMLDLIGFILFLMSETAVIYTPAVMLCLWMFGPKPSEIASFTFMSAQAFIMALVLWLFRRARLRRIAKN